MGGSVCSVLCDADPCEGLSTLTKMSLKIGWVRAESLEVACYPLNCWMWNLVVHKVTTRLKRARSGTGIGLLAHWERLIENIESVFYLAHIVGHFLSHSPILSHEKWPATRLHQIFRRLLYACNREVCLHPQWQEHCNIGVCRTTLK